MSTTQLSMLGQLWLNAYYESIGRYTNSAASDVGSFCEAAYQLKSFFERCPEQALLTRQLALFQTTITHHSAPRAAMLLLGETARRASLVKRLDRDSEAALIRELLLAATQLKEGRLFDSLDHLNRCRSYRTGIWFTPFGRWATAKEEMLRGDLAVESFEFKAAEKHYREAYDQATFLVADTSALHEFCDTWVDLVVPAPPPEYELPDKKDFTKNLKEEARWELKFIALESVQSTAAIIRATGQRESIRRVTEAFQRVGRVQLVRPLLMVQTLAALPARERSAFCALLRDMAKNRLADHFAARGSQPPTELLEQMAELTRPGDTDIAEIDVVEKLADIESHLIGDALSKARQAWNKHIAAITATKMSFPMLFAFGQQFRFAGSNRKQKLLGFHQFLQLLGGVVFENSELLSDPQYRSMIDPSIEVAAAYAVDSITSDTSDTTVPSALLSLERSPMVRAFPRLLGFPEQDRTTCERGIEVLADTLQRIRQGLQKWNDAVALITQRRAIGLVFICCESADMPIRVIKAGQAFLAAMNRLNRAAIESEDSRLPTIHALLETKARGAFNALPQDVRAAIVRHKTILLVPDYSAGHDALPFELLHDGTEYLLSKVVIARFTSLQQLAAVLDRPKMTPGQRRALVIGIGTAKGHKPLPLAETERQDVCNALTNANFDAPRIRAERVTNRFITDRMSFVDILHVSAHGETALGTERLILADGSWLESMDLERRPQSSWPFAYLNTCELGETRFLGGGRGRGLAYTLAEQGAPAVLAHTTGVFDDVSAAMATAFYREALKRPVGAALQSARKALLESYPASEIGRLVLLGDPRHALPGVENTCRADDLTSDLLDKYFDLDASQSQRSEVLTYMLNHGRQCGPRLEAAACLIMSREEATYANAGNDPMRLKDAIALSEAIGHRPSAALFKAKLAKLSAQSRTPDAEDRLRAALPDLNVLARLDSRWDPPRKLTVEMIYGLELERRGIDVSRLEERTRENPDMLRGFVNSVIGVEDLWDIEAPQFREPESAVEDIVWNAVLTGYGNRLESVPERMILTTAVVDKLVDKGYLAACARDFAIPILAAAFTCVWSTKDHGWSIKEFIAAQTRVIKGLVHDISSLWSPPEAELYAIVCSVPDSVEAALQRIDQAGYIEGYSILESEMAALRTLAEHAIESAAARFPAASDSCCAFVAGCFITKNKFPAEFQDSYTPEQLSETFEELSAGVKKLVSTACAALQSETEDELVRWRKKSAF